MPSPRRERSLITRRTTPTPTAHTLDILILLQLRLRHPTDTRRIEIRLLGLYAPQTTQLLVPLPLPLRDQLRVRVPVLQQPVVQLLGYSLLLVVEFVDVAAALVADLEDGPEGGVAGGVVGGRVLGVFHLVGEDE